MLIPFFSHKYTIRNEWRERIESIPQLSSQQKQDIYNRTEQIMDEASDKSSSYAIVFCIFTWLGAISAFLVQDHVFTAICAISAMLAFVINTIIQKVISVSMNKRIREQVSAKIREGVVQNNRAEWKDVVKANTSRTRPEASKASMAISTSKIDTFAMSAYNISTQFGNAVEQKLEKNGEPVLSRQTARLVDRATLELCLYSILLVEEKLDDSVRDSDKNRECRECLLKAFASRLMESEDTLQEQLAQARTSAHAKQILLGGEFTTGIAERYIEQINDIVGML